MLTTVDGGSSAALGVVGSDDDDVARSTPTASAAANAGDGGGDDVDTGVAAEGAGASGAAAGGAAAVGDEASDRGVDAGESIPEASRTDARTSLGDKSSRVAEPLAMLTDTSPLRMM